MENEPEFVKKYPSEFMPGDLLRMPEDSPYAGRTVMLGDQREHSEEHDGYWLFTGTTLVFVGFVTNNDGKIQPVHEVCDVVFACGDEVQMEVAVQ